jgi:hypothetical protein
MDTINNWMGGCGMNPSASGQESTALCTEEANESSAYIACTSGLAE